MKLRIARHTNDLERIKTFYTDVLGFDILGSFENHDNYNGIFIGRPDSDWHFEFTQSNDEANHFSDEDDITVLYPETFEEYKRLINKLLHYDISTISSKNTYWNTNGKMFLDPDGFRIIISNLKAS
ncbi:glyoxalase/bleomycin resistance protein/dioxygenase [Flavobacterium enshiense DK69]|uniref:Prolyl endopeptidase n=1 Tax=Flavobacterium enshiense DK69 TaxID=1107311 RepID=V6SEZ6_9FLAO|nr:VOC family protein [Flavobacterium enshiense]ESU24827.1 glyoxalase/bleomycin resistance protein/dioxygenase [Flavobacterium enshiense DK69]KGO96719.1 prolyl endopeptidase [Flavobacterium enshiense DK69]